MKYATSLVSSLIIPFALAGCLSGSEEQDSDRETTEEPEALAPQATALPTKGLASTGQGVVAAAMPIIPIPAGYGHYCSVLNATGGGWAFEAGGPAFDPCADILSRMPSGVVKRAGIWSQNGGNNVMVRCGSGLYIVRGTGSAILNTAYNDNVANSNCIFNVAPLTLPIFGHPWLPLAGHVNPDDGVNSAMSGFNYDVYGPSASYGKWDVSIFGQTQTPANNAALGVYAAAVDRHGMEQAHTGSAAECSPKPAGCILTSNTGRAFEGAYDWSMNQGRPLIAVAPGIIRGARMRNVTGLGCQTNTQGEIFIESQVDSGMYAENFVVAYHHMDTVNNPNVSPLAPWAVGSAVQRGTVISAVGNTGCSSAPHLDLSVIRLTNLTGEFIYSFQALPVNPNDAPSALTVYGVNGIQGVIDPFGWAAPAHIDPFAWGFIGYDDPNYPKVNVPGMTDPGAYSINLWLPGQAPPTY